MKLKYLVRGAGGKTIGRLKAMNKNVVTPVGRLSDTWWLLKGLREVGRRIYDINPTKLIQDAPQNVNTL